MPLINAAHFSVERLEVLSPLGTVDPSIPGVAHPLKVVLSRAITQGV